MLNCAAFSTDLILNATTLSDLRDRTMIHIGWCPENRMPGENSTLLNVSVVAEMTIPGSLRWLNTLMDECDVWRYREEFRLSVQHH